jgi:hypothetical protein
MACNSSKGAVLPRTIKAHLVLALLQSEAGAEHFAESFDQHFEDNDEPWVNSVLTVVNSPMRFLDSFFAL